jgi:hypothetical protein
MKNTRFYCYWRGFPANGGLVGDTVKRATGRGTDGSVDEFTDVLKESTGVTWADIVRKGVDVGSERNSRANKNVVSRDHSLETIPLTK